ncbi:hypothetical protein [Streptomyces sp. NPDC050856]|uniref:hypothetical protein n=1 Tax=Streptomyces sp. NPDC050856 TaxID=3154939 RepID=UPI0033D153E3
METAHRPSTRPARRVVIATGCVLLAATAAWSDLLLVVLGHVVPGWAVGGALLVTAPVIMRVGTAPRRPVADGVVKERRAVPRWVLGLAAVVAGLGSVLGAVGDLGADYRVLEPRGPGGCRAVVREASFLLAGSGEVYVAGTTGVGRQVGSWTADDGYRPVASGTYELRWGATDGVLTVNGSKGDPVWPGLHELDCG